MAKKRSTRRKTTRKKTAARTSATGKHLVIVESPAKAKTINRYLGPEYNVQASVGHVRDIPRTAPKGSKQPVPGGDIDTGVAPPCQPPSAIARTLGARTGRRLGLVLHTP